MKLTKVQDEALTYMQAHGGRMDWGQGFGLNTMFALERKGLVSVHFRGAGDLWFATLIETGEGK